MQSDHLHGGKLEDPAQGLVLRAESNVDLFRETKVHFGKLKSLHCKPEGTGDTDAKAMVQTEAPKKKKWGKGRLPSFSFCSIQARSLFTGATTSGVSIPAQSLACMSVMYRHTWCLLIGYKALAQVQLMSHN